MTDMRRTLLWVVFTMSLVFLWDAWLAHTGQPTIFGGTPRPAGVAEGPVPEAPATAAGTAAAGVPAPAALTPGVPTAASAPASVPAAAGAPTGNERITVSTDVVRATFDTQGASLVRLELLRYADGNRPGQPVVLMDQGASRLYMAQTGLVTGQPGVSLPNHLTPMRLQPGPRELAEGQDTLTLRFEAPAEGDEPALVKTFVLRRGQYTVDVVHEFTNRSEAVISPQVYLQLARDGNAPEGESSFYFTFTGPAMYTEAGKFRKIDFKDIARGNASHDRQANND